MTDKQAELLRRPFTAKEIEWRILITKKDKSKGQVAAYVDSRAIQNRLDKVIGRENWQNVFSAIPGKDNGSTVYVCELKIYYPERNEWITKSDGAGGTDIEPVKGGLSNAFKRAASMWGIGRYLYELEGVWVNLRDGKYIADGEQSRIDAAYERFLKQIASKRSADLQSNTDENAPSTIQFKSKPNSAVQPGRFTEKPQAVSGSKADKPLSNICRVIDLKISKGAHESTMVTLQKPDGNSITGYIQGIANLKTGQNVRDIKITRKTHPVSGYYNIIESFEVAA